jgi:hypothetical protein
MNRFHTTKPFIFYVNVADLAKAIQAQAAGKVKSPHFGGDPTSLGFHLLPHCGIRRGSQVTRSKKKHRTSNPAKRDRTSNTKHGRYNPRPRLLARQASDEIFTSVGRVISAFI